MVVSTVLDANSLYLGRGAGRLKAVQEAFRRSGALFVDAVDIRVASSSRAPVGARPAAKPLEWSSSLLAGASPSTSVHIELFKTDPARFAGWHLAAEVRVRPSPADFRHRATRPSTEEAIHGQLSYWNRWAF